MSSAFTLTFNLAALALYLCASGYLSCQLWRRQPINTVWLLAFALCALSFHGIGVKQMIASENGYQFDFFKASSLIFWVINALVLLSSLRKPLHNLFILLFPFSALSVALALASHGTQQPYQQLPNGLASHILLSVLAYSLLTIATVQALFLAWQNRQLKNRQLGGNLRLLPPLQTMESLLFELLWAGQLLLSASIATGLVFLDNIFAQHLAHKTVFSLLAWLIYATLLWGRHRLGWRGNTAIRWTLAGFVALMLAYFGTKLVLELILS